jgi:glycosyltransferase involved in cell wall biosynthesis
VNTNLAKICSPHCGPIGRKKIRVLQLIDTFNVGGAEKIVLSLATQIDRARFEVIPCALFRSGHIEEEMKASGIPYRIVGLPRRSILTGPLFFADLVRIIHALSQLCFELSIDIVHTHLTRSTLVGVLATRRKLSPRICATVHSSIFHKARGSLSARQWLMRTAIRTSFSAADRIIAVSKEVAHAIHRYTDIPIARITTIENAIDPSVFQSQASRSELRHRLKLPANRLVVISIGRLTRAKGYPHLLSALALTPPEERPLALIIGDGPDKAELASKVAALNLGNDVLLLGYRQDVPALLAAADLFVLPSLWEGLPLALIEAMASGLPVLVTSVGENVNVVEDGKSGLLIRPGDVRSLADALRVLLRDGARREEMGKTARERFERQFSIQSFIRAHETLYKDLVTDS